MMLDENQIKENWRQRGFSFGVFEDPPGRKWLDFKHDVDELFMLAAGEVELIIDDQSIKPAIGEEILIPAQALHSVINIGALENKWYYGYLNE